VKSLSAELSQAILEASEKAKDNKEQREDGS
jgi:hypothetical protein